VSLLWVDQVSLLWVDQVRLLWWVDQVSLLSVNFYLNFSFFSLHQILMKLGRIDVRAGGYKFEFFKNCAN